MTANEMKFSFALQFDSAFENAAPAYDDRQVSEYLTAAQFDVFLDHYDPFSNKTQRGFEDDEKRRKDLEQFIKSGSISGGDISQSAVQTGVHVNGTFYDLPDNFLYAIEENVITVEKKLYLCIILNLRQRFIIINIGGEVNTKV